MNRPSEKKGTGSRVGTYQLGKELGKGGFGTVYQGLDTATGRFVAVKQVSTKNVPKDELESIHSEINLLKKLKHDNIVRYFDSIEADGTLNIVLEFVENGSLSDIIKRFGTFTETLAVMYIAQVLHGLEYLHIQGVIHRDIKGANILTTKNGLVKLADFGVALDSKNSDGEEGVVGTPYWMAPEIIEMAGPTSKCDIWSVGCVIIELITGEPPYYHLAPLAALFHIAQDANGPKIPSGVSPVLRDFLRQCFHKQPEFRKGADELLGHPWLRVKRENLEVEPSAVRRHVIDENDEESNIEIREIKKSIQATLHISQIKQATLRRNVTFVRRGSSNNKDNDDTMNDTTMDWGDDDSDEDDDAEESDENWDQEISMNEDGLNKSLQLQDKMTSLSNALNDDEISDEFWNEEDGGNEETVEKNKQSLIADTTDRLSFFKEDENEDVMTDMDDAKLETVKYSNNDNMDRLSLFKEDENDDVMTDMDESVGHNVKVVNRSRMKTLNSSDLAEIDFGDDFHEEADESRVDKLLKFQDDDGDEDGFSDIGEDFGENLDKQVKRIELAKDEGVEDLGAFDAEDDDEEEDDDDNEDGGFSDDGDDTKVKEPSSNRKRGISTIKVKPIPSKSATSDINNNNNDDDNDVAGLEFDDVQDFQNRLALVRSNRVNDNGSEGDDLDNADPFANEELMFDEDDYVQDAERDATEKRLEKVCKLLDQMIDINITPTANVSNIGNKTNSLGSKEQLAIAHRYRCSLVKEVCTKFPNERNSFLKKRSVLLINLLKRYIVINSFIVNDMIDLVRSVVLDNPEAKKKLATLGIISLVQRAVVDWSGSSDVQLNLNCLVLEFLQDKDSTTLAIAIACGGLKSLAAIININYTSSTKHQELIHKVVDTIPSILRESKSLAKNDMYRLMADDSILPGLSQTVLHLIKMDNSQSWIYADKIVQILYKFADGGDSAVKLSMMEKGVINCIITCLKTQNEKGSTNLIRLKVKLLQVILKLAMEQTTLEHLQEAGMISVLVSLMSDKSFRNHSLLTLFYLTKTNPKRQELAAIAGIVPQLLHVINTNDPSKQIALQIFCYIAHASDKTREILWKCNALELFCKLLNDKYWFRFAITSLSKWLTSDTKRMENKLIEETNINALVKMFSSVQGLDFENCLDPIREMVQKSIVLNVALGTLDVFVEEILKRIGSNPKAMLRFNLLKLIKLLYEEHPYPIEFIMKHKLVPLMNQLVKDDGMVLVNEIASQLAQSFAEESKLLKRQESLKKDTVIILEGAIKKYSKGGFFGHRIKKRWVRVQAGNTRVVIEYFKGEKPPKEDMGPKNIYELEYPGIGQIDEKVLKAAGKGKGELVFQCIVKDDILAFVADSMEHRASWCNKIKNAAEKVAAISTVEKEKSKSIKLRPGFI